MKKLLRMFLPPFVGFFLYFICVRYSPVYFNLNIGEIGTGTLAGFMAFYKFSLPLLFAVAVLTQLLIVIPIWRSVVAKNNSGRFWALGSFVLVCLLLAAGISYVIWDHATGFDHLMKTFLFMSAVQLIYWSVNLFILRLLK